MQQSFLSHDHLLQMIMWLNENYQENLSEEKAHKFSAYRKFAKIYLNLELLMEFVENT